MSKLNILSPTKAPCYSCLATTDVVKLNVDAATTDSGATIAIATQNSLRKISNCWASSYPTTDPCIAEATVLSWALELASAKKLSNILVEGDTKTCIDAIFGDAKIFSWKIISIVANVKSFSTIFSSCSFLWVKRDANEVAHTLVRFATTLPTCFSCNSSNLPTSVCEV